MADKKITDLTAVTTVDPSDVFPLALGGATTGTRKITAANLQTAIGGSGGGGGGGLFDAVAILRDEKTAGTSGGSGTAGSWQTRTLNTEHADAKSIVSLASNQFTLAAGTYLIRARAPFYQPGRAQLRIRNITDGTTAIVGGATYVTNPAAAASTDSGWGLLAGIVTISGTKAFELQYQEDINSSGDSRNLGVEGNFGETEVYAEVEIWRFAAVVPGIGSYALLRDEKTAGTPGGTFTSGAWRTRDLNTEVDPDGIVSLASNQFTLGSGTYLIRARAPTYQGGNHKARIRDITNGVTALVGSSARVATSEVVTDAVVHGRIVVTATTVFELQHRGTSSSTTYGFGVDTNVGEVEVYAEVEITKVA